MPAAALQEKPDTIVYGVTAPRWAGQLTALSANVLLGGVTAGLWQELRGGSFKDGFARGALGGSISYAGKRISARRFDGAGLLGREIAAVGASVVHNAAQARPSFETIVLPIGPVRLHVRPFEKRITHASLDLVATGWMLWAVAEDELALDVDESLSAGTPVFRTDNKLIIYSLNRLAAGGFTPAGVVLQSYVPAWGQPFIRRVLAHERVHVAQEDYVYLTTIAPAESWLLHKLPHGRRIERYIDLNGSTELLGQLSRLFPKHADRPWELEAIYLSR